MKKNCIILSFAFFLMMLVSCVTSIPVNVERPAELDLGGAETISVVPFKFPEVKPVTSGSIKIGSVTISLGNATKANEIKQTEEEKVAAYLTRELNSKLVISDCYELIDSAIVESAINLGTEIPADIYITGIVEEIEEKISYEDKEYEEEGEIYYETKYKKTVNVSITYQVVNAKDNSIVSYKTVPFSKISNEADYKKDLPSAYSLLETELADLVEQIYKAIHPYTELKYLQLKSDKSKNPDFKTAETLAKNGMVKEAQDKFLNIYNETQNYEAAYNAAILMQAAGDLDNAYNFMKEISTLTGDKQSINALRDIQFEINSAKKLKAQNEARSGGEK